MSHGKFLTNGCSLVYIEMRIFHILYSLPHLLSQPLPITPSLLLSFLPSSLPSYTIRPQLIRIAPKRLCTRAVPLECVQTLLVLPQSGATLPSHLLNELEATVVLRKEWRGKDGSTPAQQHVQTKTHYCLPCN